MTEVGSHFDPGTTGDGRDDLVGQLRDTWEATSGLLDDIDVGAWEAPTACPGWSVRDVVAHMIGTESMLAGRPAPEASGVEWGDHVKNDVGALNEAWVEDRRARSPGEVSAEWQAISELRLAAVAAMTDAELDLPGWTPVGQAPYRRFLQIRVFDSWVHEQDIRRAVGMPGHTSGPAAEASLDEVVRSLGYVVGKRAKAPAGSRITLRLAGGTPRVIHVAVDARAAVVSDLDRSPDVIVDVDTTDFVALACGRLTSGDVPIAYSGDEALGAAVTGHLAFTI